MELNDTAVQHDNLTVDVYKKMNIAAQRSLLMPLNRRAFASASSGCVNGSLPCTMDISVHCDVFAGGRKDRPTTTSEPFYVRRFQDQHYNHTVGLSTVKQHRQSVFSMKIHNIFMHT